MINELFHGKVFLYEKIPNRSNPEYENLSAEFEQSLSQEQLEIFHQLSDLHCSDTAFYTEAAYELG